MCINFVLFKSIAQELSFEQQKEIAEHWAPIHYQSIRTNDGPFNNNGLNGKSDSLCSIDFDGDWNAINNWENLNNYRTQPSVYYYVAATSTHYFITYGFFHPRDWTKFNFFHFAQHENDLEGALFVIEKDSSEWGKLILGYSVFHLTLKRFSYCYHSIKRPTLNDRFIPAETENEHPVSYQQAKGHGIKLDSSFHHSKRDYCRYIPLNINLSTIHDQHYNLINLLDSNQLIAQINNPSFFHPDQTIKGSHGEGANPPWLWKDLKDFKKHPELQLFVDPANYILLDAVFESAYSTEYTHHPFLKTTKNSNKIP